MKTTANPNIFEYLNFRTYLRSFIHYYKQVHPAFSYQVLVDAYGFKSRSHVIDIINGRKLTPRYLANYMKFMKLQGQEAEYFKALVGYDQAQSDRDKTRYFDFIRRLAPSLKTVQLENEAYEYFSKWYQPVMISMLDVHRYEQDHRKLARLFCPKISAVQAKHALQTLRRLGFISWNQDRGEWVILQKFFSCTNEARAVALRRFHDQMQQLGMKAYKTDYDNQTFSTLTLSVSRQTKEEIDRMIAGVRKQIMEKVKADVNPEVALQVNFQTFELSASPRRGRRKS